MTCKIFDFISWIMYRQKYVLEKNWIKSMKLIWTSKSFSFLTYFGQSQRPFSISSTSMFAQSFPNAARCLAWCMKKGGYKNRIIRKNYRNLWCILIRISFLSNLFPWKENNLPIEVAWGKASIVGFEYEMRQNKDQKDWARRC